MTSPWFNLNQSWSEVVTGPTTLASLPTRHATLADAAVAAAAAAASVLGAATTTTITTALTDNTTAATTPLTSGCVPLSRTSSASRCNSEATRVMTRSARYMTEDVIYIGLLPVVAVVGTVTNAVNCAVFFKQGLRDRVNMCLFCQCLADLLFVTTLAVRYLDKTLVHVLSPGWGETVWAATLIRYRLVAVHSGFATVSNFVSTIIAMERCLCVTWPLHAAHVLSTRVLAVSIAVGSALIFAGKQFVAFKYDVTCGFLTDRPSAPPTILILPSRLYAQHSTLLDVLDSIVFSSVVPCVSLFAIAVCTAITATKLSQATAWRSGTAVGRGAGSGTDVINRKELVLTRMLVALSCVYLVCVTPRVVRSLCRMLVPDFRAWGGLCNLMIATQAVTNVLIAVNSSVNFFLFYSLGSRYKLTLRRLLARCSCTGATPARPSTVSVSTVMTGNST